MSESGAITTIDGVVWRFPIERRTVLAHGCFDLLHLGHIRHLQEAKAQGDRLVVSVTNDPHVRKGMGRPWFTVEQRMEALKALSCVDEVIISWNPDAVDVIRHVKPAVFVKGIDYAERADAALEREVAAVEAVGGHFYVTRSEKWSSTRIINGERLPDTVLQYLDSCRQRGFRDKIHAAFEKADSLDIVFVGETIIDEYRYVRPLPKPAKEFILATVKAKEPEVFIGGVIAASKHAEWKKIDVVSSPVAIRKTRLVDAAFARKLFEEYSEQHVEHAKGEIAAFRDAITRAVQCADVLVAFDFGHGLINANARRTLELAKFLAVNAQTNAGNAGFNPVTKYRRADYVCIDEPEARLAAGMQYETDNDVLVYEIGKQMRCSRFVVTRGQMGADVLEAHGNEGRDHITVPPFASQGVDTIGAGDAFLAVSAPLVAAGLELEAAALVGNVAGAIKVSIVGHRRHVERAELVQTVDALLK